MGELAQTQEAARAKGKAKPKLELVYCDAEDRELTPEEVAKLDSSAKIAAMNRGARNAGIKEGRQRERGEILKVLGVQRLQDASQINRLTAERDARPTAEAVRLRAQKSSVKILALICCKPSRASAIVPALGLGLVKISVELKRTKDRFDGVDGSSVVAVHAATALDFSQAIALANAVEALLASFDVAADLLQIGQPILLENMHEPSRFACVLSPAAVHKLEVGLLGVERPSVKPTGGARDCRFAIGQPLAY